MKKSGFTLAEILIAMGLVGVIAAMTIPTFVINGRQQANDAKFSSTIADLENAFGTMVSTELVDGFSETNFYGDMTKKENIDKYIKINGNGTTNASMYSSASPFKADGCKSALTVTPIIIYGLKNGAFFIITGTDSGYIDVNGSTKPNCLNKDLYQVNISEHGLFEREGD